MTDNIIGGPSEEIRICAQVQAALRFCEFCFQVENGYPGGRPLSLGEARSYDAALRLLERYFSENLKHAEVAEKPRDDDKDGECVEVVV